MVGYGMGFNYGVLIKLSLLLSLLINGWLRDGIQLWFPNQIKLN